MLNVLYVAQYPYFLSAIAPVVPFLESVGVRMRLTTMQNGYDDRVRHFAAESMPSVPFVGPERATEDAWDLVLFGSGRHGFRLREHQRTGIFPHGGCLGGNQPISTPFQYYVDDRINVIFAHNHHDRELFEQLHPGRAGADGIRVVGWPKIDRLVSGPRRRTESLQRLGLSPHRPTVLIATHYSAYSMARTNLVNVILAAISKRSLNVIITVHPLAFHESASVLWFSLAAKIEELLKPFPFARCVPAEDPTDLLGAADIYLVDHSSIVCEMIATTRPVIFFRHPNHVMCDARLSGCIDRAAHQFTYVDELSELLDRVVRQPEEKRSASAVVRCELFANLGCASERAAVGIAAEAQAG